MSFYTTYPFAIDPFYITVNAPPTTQRPRSPTKSPHHQRRHSQSRAGAVTQSQTQQPAHATTAPAAPVAATRKFTPPTDFYETESGFGVEISLPGVRKEDIDVEFVSDRRLVVRGKKILETPPEGEPAAKKRKYWVNERVEGEFARNIEFPGDIDVDSISVKLEHGLLNIKANKEVKKPRGKVEIEYAG